MKKALILFFVVFLNAYVSQGSFYDSEDTQLLKKPQKIEVFINKILNQIDNPGGDFSSDDQPINIISIDENIKKLQTVSIQIEQEDSLKLTGIDLMGGYHLSQNQKEDIKKALSPIMKYPSLLFKDSAERSVEDARKNMIPVAEQLEQLQKEEAREQNIFANGLSEARGEIEAKKASLEIAIENHPLVNILKRYIDSDTTTEDLLIGANSQLFQSLKKEGASENLINFAKSLGFEKDGKEEIAIQRNVIVNSLLEKKDLDDAIKTLKLFNERQSNILETLRLQRESLQNQFKDMGEVIKLYDIHKLSKLFFNQDLLNKALFLNGQWITLENIFITSFCLKSLQQQINVIQHQFSSQIEEVEIRVENKISSEISGIEREIREVESRVEREIRKVEGRVENKISSEINEIKRDIDGLDNQIRSIPQCSC